MLENESLCSYPKASPMAVTAISTTKSSATPDATCPPETSERDDSKGLTSKEQDGLRNPEPPEKTVATRVAKSSSRGHSQCPC